MHRSTVALSMFLCLLLAGAAAFAAITIPSDGSDGVFAPTANTVVDLSQATTATWNTPGTGNGVYDATQWAVVFKYQSVTIPAGVTVTFNNHPSGAPVVWLVQGNVTIGGALLLNGQAGVYGTATFAAPGPGGFPGGRNAIGVPQDTAGLGIGGGSHAPVGLGSGETSGAGSGSYATQGNVCLISRSFSVSYQANGTTYGNPYLLPLIGGSGGSAGTIINNQYGTEDAGGGAGGGAILIVAPTIQLDGSISANGGSGCGDSYWGLPISGGGSGGGIRLICDDFTGNGALSAVGQGYNPGGNGYLRLETNSAPFTGTYSPDWSMVTTSDTPQIWPATATPTVSIQSISETSVPTDPPESLTFPGQDVTLLTAGSYLVVISASNVPLDWSVKLHAVDTLTGADTLTNATMEAGGTLASSLWTATITMDKGFTSLQARAYPGP